MFVRIFGKYSKIQASRKNECCDDDAGDSEPTNDIEGEETVKSENEAKFKGEECLLQFLFCAGGRTEEREFYFPVARRKARWNDNCRKPDRSSIVKTIDVGQPGEYPYVHALAMWNAIEYLLSPAKELKFRDKETQKSEHTTIGKNYEIFQSVRADAPLIVDLTLGSVSMMIALYDMMPANAMFLHWRKTMDGRRAVPSKTFPENWTREDVRSLLAQLTLDKETT